MLVETSKCIAMPTDVLSNLSSHCSIENPIDVPVWNNMAAIKSNILKRWDGAALGVRICCIKFVQKIVQVQTPGVVADPRVRQSTGHDSITSTDRCDAIAA